MVSRDEARKTVLQLMKQNDPALIISQEQQTATEWVFDTYYDTNEVLYAGFPTYAVSKDTGNQRVLWMPSKEACALLDAIEAYEAHR